MATEKRLRLLLCHTCHSIDEIPWCGEANDCQHPGCIGPLEYRLNEHRFADGRYHVGDLGDISEELWNRKSNRPDILDKIEENTGRPGSGDGLGASNYEITANFEADAFVCWKKHNRTQDCPDFRTDRMRLIPDTKGERKDLGLETRAKHIPTQVYLCNWCPVQSIVQTKQRAAKGEYNNPY